MKASSKVLGYCGPIRRPVVDDLGDIAKQCAKVIVEVGTDVGSQAILIAIARDEKYRVGPGARHCQECLFTDMRIAGRIR